MRQRVILVVLAAALILSACSNLNGKAEEKYKTQIQMAQEAVKQFQSNAKNVKFILGSSTDEIDQYIDKIIKTPIETPVTGVIIELEENFPSTLFQLLEIEEELSAESNEFLLQRISSSIGTMLISRAGIDALASNANLSYPTVYARPKEVDCNTVILLFYQEGGNTAMAAVSLIINNKDFLQVTTNGILLDQELIEEMQGQAYDELLKDLMELEDGHEIIDNDSIRITSVTKEAMKELLP